MLAVDWLLREYRICKLKHVSKRMYARWVYNINQEIQEDGRYAVNRSIVLYLQRMSRD